ncbi:MAG: hypothetical protein JW904_04180 [Spirochaetales bacterium]|nr:hypothetical protein [Spirochaetales bacterium]
MKKILSLLVWCLVCGCIALPAVYAETFDEYRKRTEKEKQQNDSSGGSGGCFGGGSYYDDSDQQREPEDDWSRDEGESSGGSCSGIDAQTYPDHPYGEVNENKPFLGEVSVNGMYLFGQDYHAYAVENHIGINIGLFHINSYLSFIGNSLDEFLFTFAAHAGIGLVTEHTILNVYAGVFLQDTVYQGFSCGLSAKLFLPEKFIFGMNTFFSFDGSLFFLVFDTSISYAIDSFTIGVGFTYHNYNDLLLYGPTLKAAVWF